MADIDIVPKKRSSTWMWVLLAIIVLAVLFWLLAGGTQQPDVQGALEQGFHSFAAGVWAAALPA